MAGEDRINYRNLEAAAAAVQEVLVRRGLPPLDDLALAEIRQALTPHFLQERREGQLNRGAALKPNSPGASVLKQAKKKD